jgi:hypothetical protein
MIEHFLALSAVDKALAVFAILAMAFLGVTRLLGRKKRLTLSIGSGNGDSEERAAKTSSLARLEALEAGWRRDVEEGIKETKREIFEDDGALRLGDHKVRNDVAKMLLRSERNIEERARRLEAKVDELLKDISKLREDAARRGNCCEHCP